MKDAPTGILGKAPEIEEWCGGIDEYTNSKIHKLCSQNIHSTIVKTQA